MTPRKQSKQQPVTIQATQNRKMLTPERKPQTRHQHNLRPQRNNKTLSFKQQSRDKSNNRQDQPKQEESPEIHFATEKINLPRGKVQKSSRSSSATDGNRNSNSPLKVPKSMVNQEPTFLPKNDYFKDYWKLYLQNESLVADIESTAHSNYKMAKKIYNLEDYYEHNLIPQLLTYPHKFVHRLKQQQQQRQIQQQKQQQAKEQNEEQKEYSGQTSEVSERKNKKRKKHLRRTTAEIERDFICPYADCGKFYGSEGSLNLHVKIKHNGGSKTEREKLAKQIVAAYVNGTLEKELDSLDINLPPGAIQKALKKQGISSQASENDVIRAIAKQVQQSQQLLKLPPPL